MLKEFGQIAREMMFLHGHFTHPEDVADPRSAAPKTAAPKPAVKGSTHRRAARALIALVTAAGVAGLVELR